MESELQEILQTIGPQRLMMLIQVLSQMTREQVSLLMQQLAQMVESQGQQPAVTPMPGQSNMYGA